LLAAGAKPDQPDKLGKLPVIKAITFLRYHYLDELVKAGANLNVTFCEYKKVKNK